MFGWALGADGEDFRAFSEKEVFNVTTYNTWPIYILYLIFVPRRLVKV